MKNVAKIEVTERALLEWLDFKGGKVWWVSQDRLGVIEFLIEHPDLPEVQEVMLIPLVSVMYAKEVDEAGRITRVYRIELAKVTESEKYAES